MSKDNSFYKSMVMGHTHPVSRRSIFRRWFPFFYYLHGVPRNQMNNAHKRMLKQGYKLEKLKSAKGEKPCSRDTR